MVTSLRQSSQLIKWTPLSCTPEWYRRCLEDTSYIHFFSQWIHTVILWMDTTLQQNSSSGQFYTTHLLIRWLILKQGSSNILTRKLNMHQYCVMLEIIASTDLNCVTRGATRKECIKTINCVTPSVQYLNRFQSFFNRYTS